jgi:hypothetical protein
MRKASRRMRAGRLPPQVPAFFVGRGEPVAPNESSARSRPTWLAPRPAPLRPSASFPYAAPGREYGLYPRTPSPLVLLGSGATGERRHPHPKDRGTRKPLSPEAIRTLELIDRLQLLTDLPRFVRHLVGCEACRHKLEEVAKALLRHLPTGSPDFT